jgi:hypothetical protein
MKNKNFLNEHLSVEDIIDRITYGIKESKEISYFTPLYKILSQRTAFLAGPIENKYMYRARLLTSGLFVHENELKYPPREFTIKGRLNDNNEQVVYMSIDELAPICELDIGYYKIYCIAKIRHVNKETFFHYVGIKGEYESDNTADKSVNECYMRLLNNKGKEFYNATIALGRHFLNSGLIMPDNKHKNVGMVYNSVHEDITNKTLYNIAVYPQTFEACFKIEEATYNVLTYSPSEDACVIQELNKGNVQSDGIIVWEKTFEEMMISFENKYSKDIFRFSEQAIAHYKYGLGTIENETKDSFLVSFRGSIVEVKKNDLNVV